MKKILIAILTIICALAFCCACEWGIEEKPQTKTIILVDISDSLYGKKVDINYYIRDYIAQKGIEEEVGIYAFGCGEIREVCPISLAPNFRDAFNDDNSDVTKQDNGFVRCQGTDIESALNNVARKFKMSDSSIKKLILVSDGIETDGDYSKAIDDLNIIGVVIDTVYVEPYNYEGKSEMQVEDFKSESNYTYKNTAIKFSLTVKSHCEGKFSFRIFDAVDTKFEDKIFIDNPELETISITSDEVDKEKVVEIPNMTFSDCGVHSLKVEILPTFGVNESDNNYWQDWNENNIFYSYVVVKEQPQSSSVGESVDADYELTRKNFTTTISVSRIENPDINYIEAAVFDQTKGINVEEINADQNKTILQKIDEIVPQDSAIPLDKNEVGFIGDVKLLVPGLYTITFLRANMNNDDFSLQFIDSLAIPYTYLAVTYSNEYDTFANKTASINLMQQIATKTNGTCKNLSDIFNS